MMAGGPNRLPSAGRGMVPGEDRSGGYAMSSMEQSGQARSIPPEYAMLLLVAAFGVGLALAWPWW